MVDSILIFPCNRAFEETYSIIDTNGVLQKIGIKIPQQSESFENFIEAMKGTEEKLKNDLKTFEPKFA